MKELLRAIQGQCEEHQRWCGEDRVKGCTGYRIIEDLIKNNPVKVRPATRHPRINPPTWRRTDGAEIIISTMTDQHLANAIAYIERNAARLSSQNDNTYQALLAEQRRRWNMEPYK